MFNTVALIPRPEEIRLFIELLGALVSVALAAVVRALRRILAQARCVPLEAAASPRIAALGLVLAGPPRA